MRSMGDEGILSTSRVRLESDVLRGRRSMDAMLRMEATLGMDGMR